MERKEFTSRHPSETWQIGEKIAKELSRGDLVVVCGDLGSGKTQLIKGIAKGLGVRDWMYVVSPSFTLINVYDGANFPLFHVDLYRISKEEVSYLFIEEMLDEGVVAVEWGDKVLWENYKLKIEIEVLEDDERRIVVEKWRPI